MRSDPCSRRPGLRSVKDDEGGHESGTQLAFRVAGHVELYFSVRHQAARPEAPDEGYERAVAAARRLQSYFGSFGGWGPIDSVILDAKDLAEMWEWVAVVDESMTLPDGRVVDWKQDVSALLTALEATEPRFLERDRPARQRALEQAVESLERSFAPRHRSALAFMATSLGVEGLRPEYPMFLVTRTNPPGAYTFRKRGGAASLVGVEGVTDSVLHEAIFHEFAHVLDVESARRDSVFRTLRTLARERSESPSDPALENVPHALMFIQAGETMRRFYDPDHTDWGETGVYDRMGPAALRAREIWLAHLAGRFDRPAALGAIVDAFLPKAGER